MRNGSTRLGTMGIRTHKLIGAGGFCTGLSIADDGTMMVRTDTYNSYSLDAGSDEWVRDLRPGFNCNTAHIDLFYGGAPNPWGQPGTYDAAIAPSNSDVRYSVCMGYVWNTQDGGDTWTRTALAQKANCFPNEQNRMSGRPLAVDPANPAVVFFGAPDGLHYSTDYGANWTSVSTATIPTPTIGRRMCIAFGPASTVSGGRTQTIYVFVNGSGLYHTTNAASSWAAVAGSPTDASHMKVGSNGYVYLGGDGGNSHGQFRRWDPAGPAWIAPTDVLAKDIAVSPHNAGHIYRCYAGGGLDVSLDYGETWALGSTSSADTVRVATNIGWQAWTDEAYMTNGGMEFDPNLNRLWVAEGMGVWYTDNPPTTLTFGQDVIWVEYSKGIENMVSTIGAFNEAGDFGYAMHDRGLMVIPRAQLGSAFPAVHGASPDFQHGGMLDWVPGNSSKWIGTSFIEIDSIVTAWTEDAGASWSGSAALLNTSGGTGGGNIVAFDDDRWLQVQTNRAFPLAGESDKNGIWRTVDGGTTWTKCTIGDNNALQFHAAYNHSRRTLVRDAYTPGRAFAYNIGDLTGSASDLACRGIWRTTDYGATWTRVRSTFIIGYGADAFHGKFTQGSGADEWYWCGGDEALGLWRSTDGMATWNEVTGSDDVNGSAKFGEVFGFGVGKAAAGSAYPTLLAAGWRQATPTSASTSTGYGFWISFDNGATWERVAQFLDGMFDIVQDIAGCPVTFGRFVIMWGGSGASLFDYQYSMTLN